MRRRPFRGVSLHITHLHADPVSLRPGLRRTTTRACHSSSSGAAAAFHKLRIAGPTCWLCQLPVSFSGCCMHLGGQSLVFSSWPVALAHRWLLLGCTACPMGGIMHLPTRPNPTSSRTHALDLCCLVGCRLQPCRTARALARPPVVAAAKLSIARLAGRPAAAGSRLKAETLCCTATSCSWRPAASGGALGSGSWRSWST